MLKWILQAGAALSLSWLAAEELPDISRFETPGVNAGPVFFEDFNKGLEGWRDLSPGHFTYCAHDGIMGTGCLEPRHALFFS